MIKVSSLKKQFDSRGIAGLHGVSFELQKGEILGILGPNGSGKTTLLNLIKGNLKKDQGTVEAQGDISFFSGGMNSEENVQKFLVNSIRLEIDDEKKIQLTRDLADTFEFTFQLRQKLSELSSGQKQKVLLAKELINRPDLLLMDEPFAHLDPFTRKDILDSLFKYIRAQELSVIWVTHDTDEALKFSDKIALMNFGKVEQLDSPLEIIRRPKNLFVAQFIGYRNFIAFKRSEEDVLLVIPDAAWIISPEGPSYTVKERHAGPQFIEYVLEKDEKFFFWKRLPNNELLSPGEKINLLPLEDECLMIPL